MGGWEVRDPSGFKPLTFSQEACPAPQIAKNSFYQTRNANETKTELYFPRATLLFEIERHCAFPDCVARNQIGLTKQEAIEYRGFECFQCERWNEDRVSQSELPDAWATSN